MTRTGHGSVHFGDEACEEHEAIYLNLGMDREGVEFIPTEVGDPEERNEGYGEG